MSHFHATCFLPPITQAILEEQRRRSTTLLITQYAPPSCPSLCVSSSTFLNATFPCASLCQGTDFHFPLLPPKPNTADYKGTCQIPVLPTESRGEMRLRGTISFFFFWKAETRESLNTTEVRRSSWEGLSQRGAPSLS